MKKALYEQALDLFNEECEKWCSELLTRCNNDYEMAITELCQTMHNAFHTTSDRINEINIRLVASKIEQIVMSAGRFFDYQYSSSKRFDKNNVLNEWILRKRFGSKFSELTIQLCTENYIHVCSWTENWNLFAFNYETLESAIVSWADGHM